MTEHRIRLRGGWECCLAGTAQTNRKRLTLPIRWSLDHPGKLLLTRHFGRPPLDASHQELVLQLDQVAGTRSLFLNGQPIAGVSPERSRYEIPIDSAPERNTLVLEVETPPPGSKPDAMTAEWGFIAIFIRPIEPTGSRS